MSVDLFASVGSILDRIDQALGEPFATSQAALRMALCARLLRHFAAAVGKLPFHDLNADGVNGRMLLDQATHKGLQVPAGAMITALLVQGGAR